MEIKIDIECDNISDLYTHLRVLREQIKKETKKLKLNPFNDEFPDGFKLEDGNCYGEHTLIINPDKDN